MPTNYSKVEIRFWWDPKDEAIHVTTKPGSTARPLHTTFPHNEDSVRWHRSFFTWLVETLAAEGKPVPIAEVAASGPPQSPVKLRGSMWWNDPATPGRLDEFVLRHDAIAFTVTDMEDRTCYRATLQRVAADSNRFEGALHFNSGTGTVSCELTAHPDRRYQLRGKWKQSSTREVFDWNAELERGDTTD